MQTNSTATRLPQIGIIIPACNEEECIGQVLDELIAVLDPEKFIIAVGVNDSSDRTAAVARERPVVVAETAQRGYGFGCQRAIDHLSGLFPSVRAYLFCAGDGASDPSDVIRIAAALRSRLRLRAGDSHDAPRKLARHDFPAHSR